MPIDEPGPLSDVTKPMVMSARAAWQMLFYPSRSKAEAPTR